MTIVYGKTTLPSLPTLRKFPDNYFFFFAMVINVANISQLSILLFHDGKDQWLHKSIVWRWKVGTLFAQLMHVIAT